MTFRRSVLRMICGSRLLPMDPPTLPARTMILRTRLPGWLRSPTVTRAISAASYMTCGPTDMTDETDAPIADGLDGWWRHASNSADVADAEKRPSRLRTFKRIGSRRNAVAQCAGWRCRWSQKLQNPAAAVFRAATERTSITDKQRRQIAAAAIGLRPGARRHLLTMSSVIWTRDVTAGRRRTPT
jgi:hypothetical protein